MSYGPRDMRHLRRWSQRVKVLQAESPLRDLVSCQLQARIELTGELAECRERCDLADLEEARRSVEA